MSLVVRDRLQDRYEVVRSIKSGGMGAVYEAIDHKLASTPCAIKEVLASALLGSSSAYVLASFESEMRALAGLEHPNIPRVRDYFEIEGKRYIILDLVQGQGLDDELADHLRLTHQAMDPAVAAVDMVQVLETLSYLHSCQPPIIHRDIKSANLIRDSRSGRIKLVDFGIARSVETQKVQTQVGTPGFCAPEQMAGRAELRSDIYSVGATLYHLCTGRLPPAFTFDALEMELPDCPGLVKIVLKATQPKPSDRYATAEEMARALRAWLRNEGSAKIDPVCLPPEPAITKINPLASAPVPSNSQHGLWVAVLAMLLAALGLLYSDYSSRFGKPTPTPLASTNSQTRPIRSPKKDAQFNQEFAKRQALAEKAAQQREAQRLAREKLELAAERERLAAEQVRQQRVRKAAQDATPRTAPIAASYPRSEFTPHPDTKRPAPIESAASNPGPPTSPSLPDGLTYRRLSPSASTYVGTLDNHSVRLHLSKSRSSGLDLQREQAGRLAGMRRVPERERSPGEFCGWQTAGNTHYGVHIKDHWLTLIEVKPAPGANPRVWDPINQVIDNPR